MNGFIPSTDTDKQILIVNIMVVVPVHTGRWVQNRKLALNIGSLKLIFEEFGYFIILSDIGVVKSEDNCVVFVPKLGWSNGKVLKIDSPFPMNIVEIICSKWHSP